MVNLQTERNVLRGGTLMPVLRYLRWMNGLTSLMNVFPHFVDFQLLIL